MPSIQERLASVEAMVAGVAEDVTFLRKAEEKRSVLCMTQSDRISKLEAKRMFGFGAIGAVIGGILTAIFKGGGSGG